MQWDPVTLSASAARMVVAAVSTDPSEASKAAKQAVPQQTRTIASRGFMHEYIAFEGCIFIWHSIRGAVDLRYLALPQRQESTCHDYSGRWLDDRRSARRAHCGGKGPAADRPGLLVDLADHQDRAAPSRRWTARLRRPPARYYLMTR
jgi:hypothetical protein